MIHPEIHSKMKEATALFKANKVAKAYLFGSACTNHFGQTSDVDFLISFQHNLDPLEKGECWWTLYYALQALFSREIDILTEESLSNPYFVKVLNRTKTVIYE